MAKKSDKSGDGSKREKKTASNPVNTSAKRTVVTEKNSKEDREQVRVPVQLLVDYRSDGNYLFDFCRDLGTGGVFIETSSPLPMGSSLDLTFTIPDSKQTLSATGTVIWAQPIVEGRKNLTPGMGVQFKGFTGEQRSALEEFVRRTHGQDTNMVRTSKSA